LLQNCRGNRVSLANNRKFQEHQFSQAKFQQEFLKGDNKDL
jgi:hypothetical protein